MNTQIYEEASEWLVKNREGNLDIQDKGRFDAWLRESPQHVRAYLEMSKVWEDVSSLDPKLNASADELIARARTEVNVFPLEDFQTAVSRPPPSTGIATQTPQWSARRRTRLLAVAATFLIAIAGTTTWYWLTRNTYATDIGEQRSIVLDDGSIIELNSRSRVRVRFSAARRDIDLLEGQALFRVAYNTARPFVVHSETATIRAVGTQFDVYRKRASTVVTVVEGKVAVISGDLRFRNSPDNLEMSSPDARERDRHVDRPRADGESTSAASEREDTNDSSFPTNAGELLLTAGEQLTVSAATITRAGDLAAPEASRRVNTAAATAWTQRSLVFDSSPLTEIAEEFNRYNTRQLVIADSELAQVHISGVFSSVDPGLLLRFLRAQPELVVRETDEEILISKK